MSYLDSKSLEFTRYLLRERVIRPQMAMALYPEVYTTTSPEVRIVGSNTITLKFGTDTESFIYTGKSIKELAADINRSSIPVKAVALSRAVNLQTGEIALPKYDPSGEGELDPTQYRSIPEGFSLYDRVTDRGVILRIARYTIKYDSLSKIKLQNPYESNPSLPWWPIISTGSFTQTYKGKKYTFAIPEYEQQEWSVNYGRPFKDLKSAPIVVKGTNVIKVPRYPVHWSGDNLLIYKGDVPISPTVIEDIDVYNGLIYFKNGFTLTDDIRIDYTYLENNYIYKYININGHFTQNPQILDKFVVFYLLPVESTITPRNKRTVFHEVGASLQEAIDSIEIDNPDVPIAIIGAYSIQQIIASDKATIVDTRVKGGGLKHDRLISPVHKIYDLPSSEDNIQKKYKDSASFYDIGNYDGLPYPGAAAVVVDLPNYLKGNQSVDSIKNKAKKYIAAGVYPILNFENRSNVYIPGLSSDISSVYNTGLYGAYNGKTGVGWIPSNRTIPSGTVYSQWSSTLDEVTIKYEDSSYLIETTTGQYVHQSYLKSNADCIISWEERTQISPETTGRLAKYTSWEEKRYVDNRDFNLIKGYISLGSDYDTKQYKNISIFSPLRTESTGELLNEITKEILTIQKENERLLNSTEVPATAYYSQYTGSKTYYLPMYTGFLPRDISTIKLANNEDFSGLLYNLGTKYTYVGTEIDTNNIVYKYDPFTDSRSFSTDKISIAGNLELLLESAKFAKEHNIYYNHIALRDKIRSFTELVVTNSTGEYIPPEYSYSDNGFSVHYPTSGNHSGEIDYSINRMYTSADALPDIYSTYKILTEVSDGINIPEGMTGVAGACYSSYKTCVDKFIDHYNALPATGKKGNYTANSPYINYDKLGLYAGRLAKVGTKIVDHLVELNDTFGSPEISGWNTGSYQEFTDEIHRVIVTSLEDFKHLIYNGGQVDSSIGDYLYSLLWYSKGKEESNGFTYVMNNNINGLSDVCLDGSKYLLKSSFSREGQFQERMTIDAEYGPGTGQVPTKLIEALALGTSYDSDSYLPIFYAAFNSLTGLYSVSGKYPVNATAENNIAGKEGEVQKSLISSYEQLSPLFPAVDVELINRKVQ
jgi:hypothetical protein